MENNVLFYVTIKLFYINQNIKQSEIAFHLSNMWEVYDNRSEEKGDLQ